MAMTREEERELRLTSSLGTLLSSLGKRPELKEERPSPPREEKKGPKNERKSSEGSKRSADPEEDEYEEEEDEAAIRRAKEEEEWRLLEYFMQDIPDFDENDPNWVIKEKQYLIDEYGKKVVTLGYDDKERFSYNCEICSIVFNQRAMLASHCLGRKHLQRKALLDRKLQGKETPGLFVKKKYNRHKSYDNDGGNWKKRKYSKYSNNYEGDGGNFPYPPAPYGPMFPPQGPPPNFLGHWDPNMYNTPPPQMDDNGNGKSSLAGGSTGSLLQKLANCAVENEKDSDLAINVVIALMKSLKDFNHKRGETRFIEVLTEADVTFRTLKTLKPMNKTPGNSSPKQEDSKDQNSLSAADGVSGFASSNSQNPSYDDQYYDPTSYSGGQSYSGQVPTGVPPPPGTELNAKGSNGYTQDGSNVGYDQGNSYAYGYGYPGYYQQVAGPQNMQSTNNSSSGQAMENASSKGNSSGNLLASLPPPPPPPPMSSAEMSTPDLSNYGYAAGYCMGYYGVPPPTQNQPY